MSSPTHDEIRDTIDRSGCDLLAFFQADVGADPAPNDQCYLHSISHRDTELLAMDIRRADVAAVSGLMTNLLNGWESTPVKPGQSCLALGCKLMLQVVEPPSHLLDEIMDETVRAAVDYRGNKAFSVLILIPARRLTEKEVEEIKTAR